MDFSEGRQISFTRQKKKPTSGDTQAFATYVKDVRERRQIDARRNASAAAIQAAFRSSVVRWHRREEALREFTKKSGDLLLLRDKMMATVKRELVPPRAVVDGLARAFAFGFPACDSTASRSAALTAMRRTIEAHGIEAFAKQTDAKLATVAVTAVARPFFASEARDPGNVDEISRDEVFLSRLLNAANDGKACWVAVSDVAVKRALEMADVARSPSPAETMDIVENSSAPPLSSSSSYFRLAIRALEALTSDTPAATQRVANVLVVHASSAAVSRLISKCNSATRALIYDALGTSRGGGLSRASRLLEMTCASFVTTMEEEEQVVTETIGMEFSENRIQEKEIESFMRSLVRLMRRLLSSNATLPSNPSLDELCRPEFISALIARCTQPGTLFNLGEVYSRLAFSLPTSSGVVAAPPPKTLSSSKFSRKSQILLGFTRLAGKQVPPTCRLWLECLLPTTTTSSNQGDDEARESHAEVLALACASSGLLLQALDDDDLFSLQFPFSVNTLHEMVRYLRDYLFEAIWVKSSREFSSPPSETARSILELFADLHERCQRHSSLFPPEAWLFPLLSAKELGMDGSNSTNASRRMLRPSFHHRNRGRAARAMGGAQRGALWRHDDDEDVQDEDDRDDEDAEASDDAMEEEEEEEEESEEGNTASSRGTGRTRQTTAESILPTTVTPRAKIVLTELPMTVPFEWRVRLFHAFLRRRRETRAEADDRLMMINPMTGNVIRPGLVRARVSRGNLVRDAFDKLRDKDLSGRVQIEFENERGIDGGGLFKEFITTFLREIFDTDRFDLFIRLPEREEYALNPACTEFELLKFVGRVLGKAICEEILLDAPLALPLLSRLAGKRNTVHDLQAWDPVVYRNLMRLKRCSEAEFRAMGLTFSLAASSHNTTSSSGRNEIELFPGGGEVEVTPSTAGLYVERVADFRLNKESAPQVGAFLEGLHAMVDPSWLSMFSSSELAQLLGGSGARDFSAADMREHVLYAGGYTAAQSYIQDFWSIVENDFSPEQRAKLLKFITSCPRPPLLGFKELRPKITIHWVAEENGRLPTAATCVNLFRLPRYADRSILRAKLLLAIESESGFELS